jgi:hypothetical protein
MATINEVANKLLGHGVGESIATAADRLRWLDINQPNMTPLRRL